MKRHIVWILATLMLIGLLSLSSISLAKEGKWTEKADMPTARDSFSTSVVDGKIYAIGGWLPGDVPITTVEEYTPEGWPFAVSPQGKLATTWGKIKRSR